MDTILKKKEYYIAVLQKYTGWGKENRDTKNLLNVLENFDSSDSVWEVKTNLLIKINSIISPINLDHIVELPIAELYIDMGNFVVFTTNGIYNCRKTIIENIMYKDILRVDSNSINNGLWNKSMYERFFDIKLILTDERIAIITLEYGVSFRPLIYFLTTVNQHNI
jgi:hypothetical protein